jgi:hypothetical protein
MSHIRIDNWSACQSGDAYTPPENRRTCLQGKVTGHPRFDDGQQVVTAGIEICDKRIITTTDGAVYRLGTVDPKYRKVLEDNGYPFNQFDPFKTVDRLTQLEQ